MKKIFLIAGIVLGLLLIGLILLPIFYKDKIVALVKKEANENLNAKLEFADLGLNLLRNFPDFTLNLKNLTVVNNPPFAGDTLISLANFETSIDLMSLIRGDSIEIVSINFERPRLKLRALKDGTVNWNITKESAPEKPEAQAEKKELKLELQEYAITEGYLTYADEASGMSVTADGLNHKGSGDFGKDRFSLRTLTNIDSLTFGSGGIDYLHRVNTRLKADVEVDAAAKKFTLLENELRLNNLFLNFDGAVAMAGENMHLDLRFNAPRNEFKNLVSLIPAIFAKDFAELKSAGQFALEGKLKGTYGKKQYPAFDLQLLVNNGMFKYPQLPTAVNNVNLELVTNNPGGDLDGTVIDLKKFHIELGAEPFEATALVKTPISDPQVTANLKGKINLDEIKNLMPLNPKTEISGVVNSDLRVAGRMSSIEKGQYENFHADGNIVFSNIAYSAADLPERLAVKGARLSFTPAQVKLSDFACTLGKSDLQADGTLENLLPYLMKDQTLKGTLSLNSNFFDLNPWMSDEGELNAVELPDKIEFTMNANFQEVLYDKLRLQNAGGVLMLKARALHLLDFKMNLLNGSLVANGSYSTPEKARPKSFFDLKVTNFSFGETFASFLTVQKFAPIAQYIKGNFNASFRLNTDLDTTLVPVWGTLDSKGAIEVSKAFVENFKPLTKIAEHLNIDRLSRLPLKDIYSAYKIQNGRFYLEPVSFMIDSIGFVVSGSNGIDRSIDYAVTLRLPAKALNARANSLVNQLLNSKIDPLQGGTVDLMGRVGGSIDDPQVKFSTAEIARGVAAGVTSLLKEKLEKQKAAANDTANSALAKQKQEAEKLKQAAADSAKKEAERLKEEAKKRLKKLFKP